MGTSIETLSLEGAAALRLHGADGSHCTVLLRGGQLLSWCNAQGQEMLYRSPCSPLAGPAALRGGVPVVFPQFAANGPLPRHGFARTRTWQVAATPGDHRVPDSLALEMCHTAAQTPDWPHDCLCRLDITLESAGLHLRLTVHNTGPSPLSFCAALHTYLAVGDSARTRLYGLLPGDSAIGFDRAIDHQQFNQHAPLRLQTPERSLVLTQCGFADAVVWNPGADSGLGDLPADGHAHFVCVEAAQLRPLPLAPGARWTGTQHLRLQ